MAKGTGPRKYARIKLGDLLVEQGIITSDQMKAALDRQSTMGGRLGQRAALLGVSHGGQHAIAAAGKQLRGGAADAAVGAGDQHSLFSHGSFSSGTPGVCRIRL